jgi:23S rRNA pseudouridine2605 synthase
MNEVRLQKFFTDCGVLSRRAAEAEIRAGRVLVNGKIAEIGQRIDPDKDLIEYNGRAVTHAPAAKKHYILLNKPRGFVTTLSDEKGRSTVAELVKDVGFRVYPVGRLDMDSDGLLLLTDDGELTNRLTHPRHEIPKHYTVAIRGAVSEARLARLNEPFVLDGYTTLPAEVKRIGGEGNATLLTFRLYEGRNRQIRRMCEEVGLSITRLTRTAIGRITLGALAIGKYRHLSEQEVAYLKGEAPFSSADKI